MAIKEMLSTREKVGRIKAMQERLRQELQTIQQECAHENFVGKYGADTGNWCQYDDSYWITCDCPDCGRHWIVYENTHKEEYIQLSRTGRVQHK